MVLPPVVRGNGGGGGRCSASGHTLETSLVGSLPDITGSDLAESTLVASSPTEEVLRGSLDHLAKYLRQTQARETRQRTLLVEEALAHFADIIRRHVAYLDIAASCAVLQATRNAQAQAKARQAQQWQLQILEDALRGTVAEEEKRRNAHAQAELSVRRSLVQLQHAEVHPVLLREAFFRLMHAEHVRRSFLHREEARAVEAMGIPSFISLPCRSAPHDAPFGFGGGGKADAKQSVVELSKLDLMAGQRCPFRCAADCPYMLQRTRQLGKRWAAAVASGEDTRATAASLRLGRRTASPSPVSRPSQRWRVSGLGITEVGKQRVRNAMAMGHYSATAEFLPALRL
ncbi:conserved hypothetical protein [Leishmania major strain Friedlin]|uniref:Uncharacterized protein n=1 Tax=Leishmania major TaxID=5664 RepID=Q4QBV9_LEIMA|nr:conserved hypothetical protein [Leishmania major strain Friedlin]CAG9573904.1 hypothetical_protein_-_conserved [Leishmania major strain Friedlin]CAJ04025.1 conserved hypothetical protein [Leishmania major strain Friedlin]|eukprot:XP_001683189.1 conserved hypothetical protein [Leishmania major strain Friedlin]